jgi:hypothetical protein
MMFQYIAWALFKLALCFLEHDTQFGMERPQVWVDTLKGITGIGEN